jgi:hypothetical protein
MTVSALVGLVAMLELIGRSERDYSLEGLEKLKKKSSILLTMKSENIARGKVLFESTYSFCYNADSTDMIVWSGSRGCYVADTSITGVIILKNTRKLSNALAVE